MGKQIAKSASTSPPGRATVAAGFVTGMLAGLVRSGGNPASLLDAAGIAPRTLADPAVRVPVDRYAALYTLTTGSLDDEAFALFSTPMRLGSFELLCRSVASAPTLGDALERMGRFLRVLLPDVAVALITDRQAGAAILTITEARPLGARTADPARVFAFEWLLRLVHGLACWLVGRGLALDRVAFPYPRPRHADDYALIYTEHAEFDAPWLVAQLDAALLDLPIRRDEAAINLFLQGAPGKIVMLYRRDRELVLRVRELLRDALPASMDLDRAAALLHLSPRTLHRRLAEEGVNFRSIKEALRRDTALARIAKSGDTIAEIAADLGYADTSTFYRAFIDWTGMSPSAYRQRLVGRAG
jgi:AraC-like DNA-binding protein